MSARGEYERLGVVDFGRLLISSGDLDPVYIGAAGAMGGPGERETMGRWLMAYWCYYDSGAACHIAERSGSEFWRAMTTAALNDEPAPDGGRWPRGRERRHFRGRAALDAVRSLRTRYGNEPEAMAESLANAGPSLLRVLELATDHILFGPWIAFKMADMVERLLGARVDFEGSEGLFFKDPVEGAEMVWNHHVNGGEPATFAERPAGKVDSLEAVAFAVARLRGALGHLSAPPGHDRPINLQEIETVLCKWKSHRRGSYPVGEDTHELRRGLARWVGASDLAARFRRSTPGLPAPRPKPESQQGLDWSPA